MKLHWLYSIKIYKIKFFRKNDGNLKSKEQMEPVLNHDTDFALVEFQPTVLFSFFFFFFV